MNKFANTPSIKLIALDLDGTIVQENLQISRRVQDVIHHVQRQTDVRVVIATGRMFYSALPFARTLKTPLPIVAYQGAMIREQDAPQTVHLHTPVNLDIARELTEILLHDNYHVNLYMNDRVWTRRSNVFSEFYARTSGVSPVFRDNLLACLTEAPTKIMVIDDERIEHLLGYLDAHYAGRLSFCRSRSNFCEIIDVSVSKWNALQVLAQSWGIQPSEIMAIGDQSNDLSMISQAGLGVAMGNAPDHVKKAARFVTGSIEEDGVASAIEQFVLDRSLQEA